MQCRRAILVGVGLVAGTWACGAGEPDPTSVSATELVAHRTARESDGALLPFRGRIAGSDRAAASPSDRCAGTPSHPINLVVEATGEIIHLGRVRWESSHCAHADDIMDGVESVDGRGTITAANGDQLHIVYEARGTVMDFHPGPPPDLTLRVEGSVHVTGGTGRFLSARTDADQPIGLRGTFRLLEERIEAELEGWIRYEAGDRRQ
jgi:hypothetical protein